MFCLLKKKSRDGATPPGKLSEPTSAIDFFRQKKSIPEDQVGSDASERGKEEDDSIKSQGEPSTCDSVTSEASNREPNAEEEEVHAHSKIEKEPARSDEDATDGSSAEQKEEQLGQKSAEPSSNNAAQVSFICTSFEKNTLVWCKKNTLSVVHRRHNWIIR